MKDFIYQHICFRQLTFLLLLLSCSVAFSQTENKENNSVKKKRILPFGAAWAEKKGIELPAPFGVSAYYIFMSRDIDVTSVSVEFMDREP